MALSEPDRAFFDELRAAAPVVLDEAVWARVVAAYTEPQRRYHGLEHLAEMSRAWRGVAAGPGWRAPRSSFLALLFHDLVYDPRATDNEARSAAALRESFGDEAAARMVEATAAHAEAAPGDDDLAHLLDCDLAILGADPARFARYEAQVAEEYAFLPAEAWRAGRGAFLDKMIASPRIFRSRLFHDRLDAAARRNLVAARRALG